MAKKALAIKAKDDAISEEMRVLYVALTRPKEKLIIVGRQKDVNKKMAEKQKVLEAYSLEKTEKINPYLLEKYRTYLEWLELVYLKEGAANTKNIFSVDIIKKSDLKKDGIAEMEEENIYEKILQIANNKNSEEDKKQKEEINRILQWMYAYNSLNGVPTKTSVTKIKELSNIEQMQENTQKVKFNISEENTKIKVSITDKPKFLNESENTKITNAQKGTLMHLCVQKMDEKQEYDLQSINDMIDELKSKELITELEAKNINVNKLLQYTKSDLWEELRQAKEMHKEQPFYINIKASQIYDNIEEKQDENILVQGVIDLYFIDKNDKLVLVDYKTDYVENGKENELIEKYKKQLEIYENALEQALNTKVDKVGLYSLYLNRFFSI